MTELRDARLKKALDHAPDEAGTPPDAVRAAIHAHAAAQLRPALKAELPAAQPAPDARPPFWRWLLGGSGGGKHRQPWNAAFATLLLAGFVTLVVRYEQDEAPQEISGSVPTAKPLAQSPAPAPAVPVEPSRQATATPPVDNQAVQQRRLAVTADARSDAAVPSAKKAAPATLAKQEEVSSVAPAAERRAEAEQAVPRAGSGAPAPGATALFVPPPPAVNPSPIPPPPPPAPPAPARAQALPPPPPAPAAAVAVAPAAAPANIVGGAVAPAPAPQSAPVAQPFPSPSAAAPAVAQDARRESPAPAAAVGALAAPRLAVTGQRSRIDTQALLRLQASDWQTLSLRQGARVRDYTREQAAEVAALLAGMPLVRVAQLAVFDNEPNQLLVLKRDDGSTVAALTLTRDVLQGTLVVEGLGPQTVAAADAAQVARLRTLLERLAAAPTAR